MCRPFPAEVHTMRTRNIRSGEAKYGWLFVSPAIVIIGLFLVVPIALALYVSFSNWNGLGSPLGNSSLIGTTNYEKVLVDDGLLRGSVRRKDGGSPGGPTLAGSGRFAF